jgi:hypothetical protein
MRVIVVGRVVMNEIFLLEQLGDGVNRFLLPTLDRISVIWPSSRRPE